MPEQEPIPEWRVKQKREHFEKYEALAQRIGLDRLRAAIPFTPEQVRRALEAGDEYLNTLPLKKWDQAVGFLDYEIGHQEKCPCCGNLRTVKWTAKQFRALPPFEEGPHTASERVSLLKHVARYYLAARKENDNA